MTAALLWLLLDRHASRASADLGLVVFLFTPLAMLWSRTSSIEYVVTAGSVGFVLAAMELRTSWRTSWWWIALLAASVAMLVKPTTALFYLAPAVLVLPLRRRFVASAVLLVLPLALGIAWTVHADAIKAATPSTAFLTSSALTTWNFGTMAQRLNAAAWSVVLQRWVFLAGGLVLLPLLLRRPGRHWNPLVPWMLAAAVLPILVFFNLYVVHDYYLVAITPAVAALVGLAAGARNRRPVLSAAFVAAALVVATFSYWSIAYDPDTTRTRCDGRRPRSPRRPRPATSWPSATATGRRPSCTSRIAAASCWIRGPASPTWATTASSTAGRAHRAAPRSEHAARADVRNGDRKRGRVTAAAGTAPRPRPRSRPSSRRPAT